MEHAFTLTPYQVRARLFTSPVKGEELAGFSGSLFVTEVRENIFQKPLDGTVHISYNYIQI
jgi:hypothetical protein